MKNDIIKWIKEYFAKNSNENSPAIIGLSGGKDSAICAALCVEALGKERVIGVAMPHNGKPPDHEVYDLIHHLGIMKKELPIKNLCDEIATMILNENNPPRTYLDKTAINNIPSRIRMAILYAIAASLNGRVCNTSNLSERFIGYTTKYGDNVGDFSPLGNLTCTEVIELGRTLNIPVHLVERTPEDGLSGKTDEDNIGFSYTDLDAYIKDKIKPGEGPFNKILEMNKRAQHKIICMPIFG